MHQEDKPGAAWQRLAVLKEAREGGGGRWMGVLRVWLCHSFFSSCTSCTRHDPGLNTAPHSVQRREQVYIKANLRNGLVEQTPGIAATAVMLEVMSQIAERQNLSSALQK